MAARITPGELKVIYSPPDNRSDGELLLVIEQVNELVNDTIKGKECEETGVTVTESTLKGVELYLSAYFFNPEKTVPTSTSVLSQSMARGGALQTFAGMLGNPYGQIAIERDCTGTLRQLATRLQAVSQGDQSATQPFSIAGSSDADETVLT